MTGMLDKFVWVGRIILLAAWATAPCFASQWVELGSLLPEDSGTVREVDVDSLESKFGFLRAWVRTSSELPTDAPNTAKQSRSSLYMVWMNSKRIACVAECTFVPSHLPLRTTIRADGSDLRVVGRMRGRGAPRFVVILTQQSEI
jgi:hypothetical protein